MGLNRQLKRSKRKKEQILVISELKKENKKLIVNGDNKIKTVLKFNPYNKDKETFSEFKDREIKYAKQIAKIKDKKKALFI